MEVDGAVHDPAYDAERDRVFGHCQVRVLRFTNDTVERRLGEVAAAIQASLRLPPA